MKREKEKRTIRQTPEGGDNKNQEKINIENIIRSNKKIIQEGNSYYEIDLECIARKKKNQEIMEYRRKK